jgi:hypothetical protein
MVKIVIFHKGYNLRIYVLVVCNKNNYNIYAYINGFMYYTSKFFEKNSMDFDKNITSGYIDRQVYKENPLTHEDLREYLDSDRQLSEFEKYLRKKLS